MEQYANRIFFYNYIKSGKKGTDCLMMTLPNYDIFVLPSRAVTFSKHKLKYKERLDFFGIDEFDEHLKNVEKYCGLDLDDEGLENLTEYFELMASFLYMIRHYKKEAFDKDFESGIIKNSDPCIEE